ncbi:hypothetical protein CHCC20442_1630 [Bacillus licheniformis]|nr:hypothetical protein CHCC20442_1630 [Bacillus licheniformis]
MLTLIYNGDILLSVAVSGTVFEQKAAATKNQKKHLTLLVENVILIKSLRTEAEMIFEN